MNEEEDQKFQVLKKWRLKVMRSRRMEHSLLPSNRQLIQLIRAKTTTVDEIKALRLFSDWKAENYSPSLLSALRGENYDQMVNRLTPIRSKEAFFAKRNPEKD